MFENLRALTLILVIWGEEHQPERSQDRIAWLDQQRGAVMRLELEGDSEIVKKLVLDQ